MLLGEILHPGVITTSLVPQDKQTAIEELVDLTISAGDLPRNLRAHALEIVRAREASMSTGMERGIALPHATSDRLDNVVAALGVARNGIEWGCLDGAPARLIILLIMPRRKFQTHVRTLASISHLLNSGRFCDTLLKSGSPEAMLRLIETEERDELFDAYRS